MDVLTYKLIYVLNAIVFLCLGGFFSLTWFAKHRRKTDPFLVALFASLSVSYVLHALTYAFQNTVIFETTLMIDLVISIAGMIFLSVVIGREGIPPFKTLYNIYAKIAIARANNKFKKNLKKITKDI